MGSLAFLLAAPGTVAGVVPFALTGWRRAGPPHTPMSVLGVLLILAGLLSLLESFARFVVRGRGTPSPTAPPRRLVVTGQYRYLRNPMYVAVVSVVLGQAALLASATLLAYAAVLFLLFHAWVTGYEEPRLARQFGESYARYRRAVRRWRPRARAWNAD